MATFLDYRASIGSTTFGSPNSIMSTSAINPNLIGSIGLIVGNATGVRVQLQGLIGVTAGLTPATVFITIVRNNPDPALPAGGTPIFSAVHVLDSNTTKTIAINAADLNPPTNLLTPGQINYSLFVQNSAGGAVVRSGPENFEGMAVAG